MSSYQSDQNLEAPCSVNNNPSSYRTAHAFNVLPVERQTFTNRSEAEFKEGLVNAAKVIDSRLKNSVRTANIATA
jgi:hypothetical protein